MALKFSRVHLDVSKELSYRGFKATMYRSRRATLNAIPRTLIEFGNMMAQSPMRLTISGESFFRATITDPVGGTSLVFSSPKFVSVLSQARELHLDGTFKVRPNMPPSRQMLTVMAMHFNHVSTQ